MLSTYQVLFSVVMRHPYFSDERLRVLTAQPTPATAMRLRRFGVLYRTQPDGFVLLYAAPGAGTVPPAGTLVLPPGLFPLLFSLVLRDPYLPNYSDLPLAASSGAGPTAYCLAPAPAPGGTGLQQGPAVGADDQLPLRPLQFTLPVAPSNEARPVRLFAYRQASAQEARRATPDGFVEVEVPAEIMPAVVPAQAASLPVDLRPWGSGRYRLQVGTGKQPQAQTFFADDYLSFARPWGQLEIGAHGAPPLGTDYTLQFATRATYWHYHVVARHRPLPTDMSIVGGAGLVFKNARSKLDTITSKSQALTGAESSENKTVIEAQAEQLFAQLYNMLPYQLSVIDLDANGQKRPSIVHPALPNATPHTLRLEGSKVISDIFVYI
jgi:hypothetical protein